MNANFTLKPVFVGGQFNPPVLQFALELFEVNPDGSATTTAVITASPSDTIDNLLENVIDVDVRDPPAWHHRLLDADTGT